MSTPPVKRRPPVRPEHPTPAVDRPAPLVTGRIRRIAARIGAAVRAAHSASVPF
jgi:hypothetical protein